MFTEDGDSARVFMGHVVGGYYHVNELKII